WTVLSKYSGEIATRNRLLRAEYQSISVKNVEIRTLLTKKLERRRRKLKRRRNPNEEVPFSGACSGDDHVPGHR
ncbi:hypothetical protein, partial [Oscillibacter valericigenes]|uniref:hypothetical protein n=1 Tax=Oscillibacter valericigenes TaxID=351091 RepID=UPI00195B55FE